VRVIVMAIGAGMLAFVLSWSAWHLYVDHQIFHSLLTAIAQQQAKQGAPK
jgi:hypothetical protein